MCGIVGIVGPPEQERGELLRRMLRTIVHRGPDSEGLYENDEVALGMRRLSIIDVKGGEQPAYDENKSIVVVFNGEIYNFRELQLLLTAKGHRLRSGSDTECIPHLYEEFGLNFVDHLRGMFAIALWDRDRRRLVLARDRLGKKPLYYRVDGGGIAFGSELKALLADPRTDREVDKVAISHYLTYQYVPAPWSAIKSVRKLEPGHVLVYEDAGVSTYRYWELRYAPKHAVPLAQPELELELRRRLIEAVKLRMISERPLGAFLSGGVDSSAVVAAMSHAGRGHIKTFSIGFEEDAYNELPYARQVADLYGTEHHELVVKPNVLDILPILARSFDEPYADSSAIPSYYLAQMASREVVVALNGDGGDEAFGGYLRYLHYLTAGQKTVPPVVARLLRTSGMLHPLGRRSSFMRKVARAGALFGDSDPARRYARFLSYFRPEEKRDLFTAEFASRVDFSDSYDLVARIWQQHQYTDSVNRLLAVDTHTYLPGDLLPKVDITTMAWSLEARSPFLDQELIEWAASLPGSVKLQGRTTKHLLKAALAPWLPDHLIHRRKMGFGVPLGEWLRGPLKNALYDLLTDDTARRRGWFRPIAVDALLREHMAGQDHSPRLYALLMLEMWQREVLERPVSA